MIPTPRDESELVARAAQLAGRTLGELAQALGTAVPRDLRRHKGWAGGLIERALGASAGSSAGPDFPHLGIEVKTIPVGRDGRPRESTHVCVLGATEVHGQRWPTSSVRRKLARVLFVPLEAEPTLALAARPIGRAVLWSPSATEERVLAADWEELVELVATGSYEALDGRLGSYLQLRPKAADGRARTAGSDAGGAPVPTLPRGFYLRPAFTATILARGGSTA